MTLSDAADLIDRSIQNIYKKHTNMDEENYKKYYTVSSTEDYYEKDSSLSGFSEASRITENAVIVAESPVQGFDKTYTQVFFGKMAVFTMYDWKFGIKRRKLEAVVKDLSSSVVRMRERHTTLYLVNSIGANTSMTITDDAGNYSKSVVGGDGVALVNSAHTREDGGSSWSNVISDGTTSNMDFDYDGVKAAHRTASLVTDPKGNLMNIDLDTIIVRKNSSNAFRAKEILGAIRKGDIAGSADNDGAGVPAYKIIELPYIPSANADYWWMMDSKLMGAACGLQIKESQGIVFEGPEIEFKTGSIFYKSTAAYDFGHNDGRCFAGSTGVNA